ncbi:MAG: hypothetical protein MPJ50_11585 [Pirellulales bacterium]|nr:hypothetical protein [Pirellulales bacterium]
MRRLFVVALAAVLAAGCQCPYLGPCASVDREGWTSFFSGWGRSGSCDDCGCLSGQYSGPPANPRGLYRYSDEFETVPESGAAPEPVIPLDTELVPPPTTDGGLPSLNT